MQDAIQRFISAADNFLSRYGIYKFHGGPANFATEPQKGSFALALLIGPMQPSLCQVRCQLEKAGEGLPAMLVRDGHDGRALLRFCNAIREADFETAIPLWPALKADLQQVAIVAGLPPRPAATASNGDGAQADGSAKGKRKRSRKDDTKVKTYAAITYKAQHPDATEEQCAKAQNMPRTTLAARAEWQEWSRKIDHAAASGRLPKIKAEWDDRIGELVAVEKEETT